jgi:predicted NBD/HSP70 family sugar kinase
MKARTEHVESIRSQTGLLRALGDAAVQAQLQLTTDQQEQIRAILRNGFEQATPIWESLAELQRKTLDQATAVFSDEQNATWEQMDTQFVDVQPLANRAPRLGGPGMRGWPRTRWQPIGPPRG